MLRGCAPGFAADARSKPACAIRRRRGRVPVRNLLLDRADVYPGSEWVAPMQVRRQLVVRASDGHLLGYVERHGCHHLVPLSPPRHVELSTSSRHPSSAPHSDPHAIFEPHPGPLPLLDRPHRIAGWHRRGRPMRDHSPRCDPFRPTTTVQRQGDAHPASGARAARPRPSRRGWRFSKAALDSRQGPPAAAPHRFRWPPVRDEVLPARRSAPAFAGGGRWNAWSRSSAGSPADRDSGVVCR